MIYVASASGRDRQARRQLSPTGSVLQEGARGLWGRREGLVQVATLDVGPGTRVGGGQGKKAGKGDRGKGSCFSKAKAA